MLPNGIRRLFRLGRGPKDVASDVDAELQFHLEQKIAALVGQGMSPAAAREEALRQFGDVRATRAALEALDRRAAVGQTRRDWLADWWLDVRHALRSLRRTPGVTVAVIVMLALGIGANAAMFDILDRLFLRPPAGVEKPEEVYRLYKRQTDFIRGRSFIHTVFDFDQYEALTAGVGAFRSLAGYTLGRENLGRGQQGGRANVSIVTASFFDLLGVRPALGRLIGSADDLVDAEPAAVVSHAYWRRHYAGRPDILGATFSLNDVTYTIVGVAPRGFGGPHPNAADLWVPARIAGPAAFGRTWRMRSRGGLGLYALMRLVPGAGVEGVAHAATTVLRGLEVGSPFGDTTLVALAGPIALLRGPAPLGRAQSLSLVVGGVALIVLLVAVANVASLLLARAAGRRRELAIRAALGAGRWRVARLLLLESATLAVPSAVAAAIVATAGAHILRGALLPSYQWASGPLDLRLLAFAFAVAVATAVLTGAASAIQAARGSGRDDLRAGVRAARRAGSPVRSTLLVLQTALSLALLVGSGLFLRSFDSARRRSVGFDVDQLAIVNLSKTSRDDTMPLSPVAIVALERRIRGIPGVTAVAQSTAMLMGMWRALQLRVPGLDSLPRSGGFYMAGVTPDFFTVTGLPIVRGRAFEVADDAKAPMVAVVNTRMADLVWARDEPLGKCFYAGPEGAGCRTVVGVVETVQDRGPLETDLWAQYYLPLDQTPHKEDARALVVRTSSDSRRFSEPILRALSESFPDLPRERLLSLPETFANQNRSWRIGTGLFAVGAGLALLLAAIGLYSVIAFGVRQREHEFGIRRALGADTRHLMRLVLAQGFTLAVAGVVLGTALAAWGGKFIKPLLFQGREPHDPVAFGVAAGVLLVAALAASLIPVLQAARVDPRQALQAE